MKTILKIPFDAGIINREKKGAAKAPDIIQSLVKNAIWKEIEISNFDDTQKNIIDAALKEDVIGIGGDHSVSYGLMKAFSEKYQGALVYFDAHLDCEDDFLPPSHEDVIKAIVNENIFSPENILIIGARKFYPKELEFIKKYNIKLGVIGDIKEFVRNKKNLYISIDIDVFDPKFAPGTGWPEKDGLDPKNVIPILKDLLLKVKGADIVEVCPEKDVNNKTAELAARLLTVFLGKH